MAFEATQQISAVGGREIRDDCTRCVAIGFELDLLTTGFAIVKRLLKSCLRNALCCSCVKTQRWSATRNVGAGDGK